MNYNAKNIKKFKGRLIILFFLHKRGLLKYPKSQAAIITATTKDHLLFRVNNEEPEIILNYSQIENIEIPKKDETSNRKS